MTMESMLAKWEVVKPHCDAIRLADGDTFDFCFHDRPPDDVTRTAQALLEESVRGHGADYSALLCIVGDDVPLIDKRTGKPSKGGPLTMYAFDAEDPKVRRLQELARRRKLGLREVCEKLNLQSELGFDLDNGGYEDDLARREES